MYCINKEIVPPEALDPSAYPIQINGVNSQQIANQTLKNEQMSIEENRFRIPFTYTFPMEKWDGIQMLIGCNFIRAPSDVIIAQLAELADKISVVLSRNSASTP